MTPHRPIRIARHEPSALTQASTSATAPAIGADGGHGNAPDGHGQRPPFRRSAPASFLAIGVALAVAGLAVGLWSGLSGRLTALALLKFGVIAGVAGTCLRHRPVADFGLANRLTTARAAITALLGALTYELWQTGRTPEPALLWLATALATIALVLDAADGIVARRRQIESPSGARFDMEIDALLILCLSLLVVVADRVAAWAVLIGLMRYGFVAARALWPWLRAPLAESMRRKIVCALQGILLCVVLAPVVDAALAALLLAVALAALGLSFAIDTVRLWRAEGHGA